MKLERKLSKCECGRQVFYWVNYGRVGMIPHDDPLPNPIFCHFNRQLMYGKCIINKARCVNNSRRLVCFIVIRYLLKKAISWLQNVIRGEDPDDR